MMEEELDNTAVVVFLGVLLEESSYFLGGNLIPNWN